MERRKCQLEATEIALEQLQSENEVNIAMCTGAGKSYVIKDVCDSGEFQRRIIVFPSLMLLQQYHKQDYVSPGTALFYFSTEGTLKDVSHLSKSMDELDMESYIVLTTYNSAPKIYASLHEDRIVDLVVHDEVHHIVAPIYAEAFNIAQEYICSTANFSATLPDTKYPDYSYSLLQGIRDKVVRDFVMELFLCRDGETAAFEQMIEKVVAEQKLHKQTAKILVYTAEANTDGSSVKTFLEIYGETAKARGWWMNGINEDTKDRDGALKDFQKSKAEAAILVSCRTLSEGIDLHGANVMLPWDPTNSIRDNIQRIGRVVRLYKTTTHQTDSIILIPVFLCAEDYEACADRAAVHALLEKQIAEGERGNFSPIVNISAALKSELADEDVELFNRLLTGEGSGSTRTSIRANVDLIECVAKKLKKSKDTVLTEMMETSDNADLVATIATGVLDEHYAYEIADALAQSQNIQLTVKDGEIEETFGCGKTKIAVANHNGIYRILRAVISNTSQKHIVARIRVNCTSECQIVLGLDDVDIKTETNFILKQLTTEVKAEDNWEKRRQEWTNFYDINGKTPAQSSNKLTEARLGNWQTTQRTNYKRKTICLTHERILLLETMPGWRWENVDMGTNTASMGRILHRK
jgi:superfamily II DNA or RNA helicase